MGYRSDVVCEINIRGKKPQTIKAVMEEELGFKLSELFDEVSFDRKTDSLVLIAYDIEWYRGYNSDIDKFESYISDLGYDVVEEDEEHESFIYFARIGEDLDDMEERNWGEWDSNFYIVRKFDYQGREDLEECEDND